MLSSKETASEKDLMILYDNLAFSSPRPTSGWEDTEREEDSPSSSSSSSSMITAVARVPFSFDSKDCVLNVELFGDSRWKRVLCFVPGVCESAETWTVQNLAKICDECQWRLAVLELEGCGLSSGPRALLNGGLHRLVQQVVAFCHHVVVDVTAAMILQQQQQATALTGHTDNATAITFALCGDSLGGALAAYASQAISESIARTNSDGNDDFYWEHCHFVGTLLLSPAVGVDPGVVPSKPIVMALTALSIILPSVGFMTPEEDPSQYNCPPWTTRNFVGLWPLRTSKLLLDITSTIVPEDIQNGTLNMQYVPLLYVIAGTKDAVVPIRTVRTFVQGILDQQPSEDAASSIETNSRKTKQNTRLQLIEIKNAGHGLLEQPPTKSKTTQTTLEHVSTFLNCHPWS